MSTLNTEQLNHPIKDLRRVTILFGGQVFTEHQVLTETVQAMKERYSQPGVDPPVFAIVVAKPLGFDADGVFRWDERNQERIWSSEEKKGVQSRGGHA